MARESRRPWNLTVAAEQVARDLVNAARRLWVAPLFTAFSALSLATGIGVTVAVHAALASMLTVPIGGPNANRVVLLHASPSWASGRSIWRGVVSHPDYQDLEAAQTSLVALAASAPVSQVLATDSASTVVAIESVSGRYFQALGVAPRIGRLLGEADDIPAAPSVAVIGEGLWRSQFSEDPAIIGRSVRVGGHTVAIVGIAASFDGLIDRLRSQTDIWMPAATMARFASSTAVADLRARQTLSVFGLLRDDRSIEQASAELTTIGQQLDAAYPLERRPNPESTAVPQPRTWSARRAADVNDRVVGEQHTGIAAVVALVGLVLVAACSNLATLVLSRGTTRRHEIAVRRALGATRWQLVREQLAESAIIAVIGVFGALLIVRVLVVVLAIDLPIATSMSVRLEPRIDVWTLIIVAAAGLSSLVIFGLIPALNLTRQPERAMLASEASLTTTPRWRGRRALITAQVTISTAFLLTAALAAQVAFGSARRDSGVDVDRLAIGFVNFRMLQWDDARVRVTIDQLIHRARQIPGVSSAAMSAGLPFGLSAARWAFIGTADAPVRTGSDGISAQAIASTPDIFATIGVRIVAGRAFDSWDGQEGEPVAVLSERAARDVFGTTDVVGRDLRLRAGTNMTDRTIAGTRRVIGIARDTDTQRIGSRSAGIIYLPLAQHYDPFLVLIARTPGDPAAIVGALRSSARSADPDLALEATGTGPMVLATGYELLRVVGYVAVGLAGLAMVLAMTGLYGVLSHLVSARTREFGLRIALGASATQIRTLVVRQGLAPVARGLALGGLIGILVCAAVMALRQIPFSELNVVAWVFVPFPLLGCALVACCLPARRAARVDPNLALRAL